MLESGVGLITAGAGYGKTCLLASWTAPKRAMMDVAWLALEPDHNDPLVLADHLRLAVRPFLQVGPGGLERVVAVIARAAIGRERPLLLVLDDAHQLNSNDALTTLGEVLNRRPPGLYVVIAGRAPMPGPWTRLRAMRELVELHGSDLAFDDYEARALLTETFGVDPDEETIQSLQRLTEGWAAGLCLAGHALTHGGGTTQGPTPPTTLDEAWRYLEEESLQRLDRGELRFLEQTSILRRLDPEICSLLAPVHRELGLSFRPLAANIFTERVSSDPPVYRYHPLLRVRLCARLEAADPEEAGRLRDRASRIYEARGMIDPAIELASANGDVERVVALFRAACGEAGRLGYSATNMRWLSLIPKERIKEDAELSIIYGTEAGRLGDIQATAQALEDASAVMAAEEQPQPASIRLGLRRLDYYVHLWRGELSEADDFCGQIDVYNANPGDPGYERLEIDADSLMTSHAVVALYNGRLEEAIQLSEAVLRRKTTTEPTRASVVVAGVKASALAWADHPGAREAARYALGEVSSYTGADSASYMARHAAAWALEGSVAQEALGWLSAVAERLGQPLVRALTALATARVLSKSGSTTAVAQAIGAAEDAVGALPQPAYLEVLLGQLLNTMARPHLDPEVRLSPAEIRVLEALGRGGSRAEVARRLHLSVNTIKTHQRVAYRKLGVSTRAEALALARARGLTTREDGEAHEAAADEPVPARWGSESPWPTDQADAEPE